MINREKVIKKLAFTILTDSEAGWNTIELPIEEAKDILTLLKEQEEKICSAKEIAKDESTNATWREDFEAWKVLDRIVQKLS